MTKELKPVELQEFAELSKELRDLKKEFKKERKGYLGQIARLQAKLDLMENNPSPSEVESKSNKVELSSEVSATPHYVGSWHKYCPDCGEVNPEFKDETFCVDCNIDIGAAERIADIKACPNCGKDHFKLKDGVELSNEVLEKLKSKGVQILESR